MADSRKLNNIKILFYAVQKLSYYKISNFIITDYNK